MKLRSIAYFKARSLRFKLFIIFWYPICLVALINLILPITDWALDDVFPKLPIGKHFRTSVLIELPQTPLPKRLLTQPEQVLAYQSEPHLELVGVGKKFRLDSTPPTIEIGLFPSYRNKLLKPDSQAVFYYDSPSLALLIQKVQYGEKRNKLNRVIVKVRHDFQKSMNRIWPHIKDSLASYFEDAEVSNLLHDPIIMNALKGALISEVQQRITISKLKDRLSQIPEIDKFLIIATGELSSSKLSQKALQGVFIGAKQGYKTTSKEVKSLWADDILFKDSVHCFIETLSHKGAWSARVLSTFLSQQDSRLCKKLKSSLNGLVLYGMKAGAKEFSNQAWDNLYRDRNTVLSLGKSAGVKVIDELKVKPILKGFWRNIKSQDDLHQYIISSYGVETWEKLKKALAKLSVSPTLSKEIVTLSKSFEYLIENIFVLLLLNDQENGPNPLLVTMIQEKLSGVKRTVVWIKPGQSPKSVGAGHLLKSGR